MTDAPRATAGFASLCLPRPLRVLLFGASDAECEDRAEALGGGMQVERAEDEAALERRANAADVLVICAERLPGLCLEATRPCAVIWLAPAGAQGPADAILPAAVPPAELREAVELIGARALLSRQVDAIDRLVGAKIAERGWRGRALTHSPGELARLAVTDPLTELFNRRYLEESLPAEWERAVERRVPVSVLVLDLDNFKPVNDTLGHRAGDAALVQASARLCRAIRGGDVRCRYGGDEFAVLARTTDSDAALQLAERVRGAISETPFEFEGHAFRIGASVGCATAPDDQPQSSEQLLHMADLAMLAAKRAGRNRVCRWGDLPRPPASPPLM